MKKILLLIGLFSLVSCGENSETTKKTSNLPKTIYKTPNVIILYVDDLGYADVGVYGAKGVKTPNIDSMARGGIRFTDAHSSAATCTPSRYSLLTGNYAFRNNAEILPGDAPLLIDTNMNTMPKMFQKAGYTTGVIGKWHLGLGYGQVDWNKPVKPGPAEVGFDYSFLLPATGDRVPTVFLENDKVINLSEDDPITVSYDKKVGQRPLGTERPDLLKMKADLQHSQTIVNEISRIGYMGGGKSAEWIDEEFPYVFNSKAEKFIRNNKKKPFFLFYSFHDIHVPRVPHANFTGKSEMGARGDAIVQVDYVVGEINRILKEQGIAKNTLIIFTSDNGPVLDDGYADKAKELLGKHNPSGPFRGGKYSIYEAGTRVPTIAYWPDNIEPRVSDALLTQLDFFASFAEMLGIEMGETVIDSESHLDALFGKTDFGRQFLLEEGFTKAIRDGKWKYIQPFQNGQIPDWMANKEIEPGLKPEPQLFNLSEDKGEQKNLADKFPEKVKAYQKMINSIVTLEK
ncbi:sulfatase family protein [Galbibacter mesophilus]|uniref:sulfatase family protein n=1 Tax=Galbibacter mesophilus TaxID=379069 RepID=UPI00191D9319|nr:arylsulfatase [Galbibacter mesophilus]MCM5661812.1 arylsulfatase [Galbibacter mesophilus]